MDRILVVEDNDSLRNVLSAVLQCEGYEVSAAESAESALELFRSNNFSAVLTDFKLPQDNGLALLSEAKKLDKSVPIIVMTAYGNVDLAVDAMKLGANDFISKPFDPPMLCSVLAEVLERRKILNQSVNRSERRNYKIISQCPNIEQMLADARKVAALNSPVLILGESGTGKELFARYIHQQSPRAEEPFVPVNCGATPAELLESEFFGHEEGAFTGAIHQRIGLFEVADKGTIFLDEIGDMPHDLQVKLLRCLQESEIKRVGSSQVRKVNVRVVSATHADLRDKMGKKEFREDLYYRLGVVILEIPPLRERREDIALLAHYFVKSFCEKEPKKLGENALKRLMQYNWPGNIRELENVLERACLIADGDIDVEHLEFEREFEEQAVNEPKALSEVAQSAAKSAEIEAISRALEQTQGNKSKAAKMLNVSYKTLLNKVKEYDL